MEKLLICTGKELQDLIMDTWLKTKALIVQPLAVRWFNEILNCGSDAQSIFHDGCPMGCVNSTPFAYVNAFRAHVNIGFFYGTELFYKTGMLEGNEKRMRHVRLLPDQE